MISKSQQNMAILDDNDTKYLQTMDEMPKNLSLDKNNCDNSSCHEENMEDHDPDLDVKDIVKQQNLASNKNNSESVKSNSNEFPSETRIQLSFSVDRLLNDNKQKNPNPTQDHRNGGHGASDKCCDEMNTSYSCCSLPNCLVNASSAASAPLTLHGSTYPQSSEEEIQQGTGSTYMDFKSIVRPTPVRALGNNSETVPSLTHFSALTPTSLIRFHHAQLQQHQQQQQKQLSQHLPAQPNFTMSSLMNPLCGLKPLQLNAQQMRLQNFATSSVNRFTTKGPINFDIPIVRSNLACISTLRHHHIPATNSSETHMSFNSTSTTSSMGNSSTTNTNSGTSHGNNISTSGKRKRSWSRAVFTNLQRKGLEIQFQQQKYITKPDRRKLAATLNLTDAQVKVWFQNRRMKWRHTRENLKSGQEKQPSEKQPPDAVKSNAEMTDNSDDGSSSIELSEVDDDDDEIDVVE